MYECVDIIFISNVMQHGKIVLIASSYEMACSKVKCVDSISIPNGMQQGKNVLMASLYQMSCIKIKLF